MAIFVTSDEHYGHRNILKFCKRPFADIFEMREALIAAHNAKVTKGDLTYHLGDMFWRTTSIAEALLILSLLNGQHALVWGNHDEVIEASAEIRAKFTKIGDVLVLNGSELNPKIVLCHYAMRVWRGSHNGTWQLYGHSHAALPEANTLSFDVGVDTRPDFAPWSMQEIADKMKAKKAAGAKDLMSAVIEAEPWNKDENAEAAYPILPMPCIPPAVWDAIRECESIINHDDYDSNGRCVD
jgi:calcineurin-like phosphoesterase family protein